jgi:phosphopantothenoylcysteine decarboxylase / phosphopantothenate---cysteine ligase
MEKMTKPYQNKRIILGVTGSIACYKAADLASKLTQEGALVDVILTPSAAQFITTLTFQSITGRRAFSESDLWGHEGHVLHVGLGHSTDLVVIAPATANTMAKLASGIADNMLTVTALASSCPLLLAPAMDLGMFTHPATQKNLEILKERGAIVAGPVEGRMASGLTGLGRMVEPWEILGAIRQALSREGKLKGKKVVITAGGTLEPVDTVRVLANRSSGKQGYSLAQAALDLGAQVVLISGPANLPAPAGARMINIETAQEMLGAVLSEAADADALVMAAAVADFRPSQPASQKLKKESGIPEIKLELAPDILSAVSQLKTENGCPRVTVGFAAESQNLLENAISKLHAKKMDLIIANDITARDAGFSVDTNRVAILDFNGNVETLPLMTKTEVAEIVIERVASLLGRIRTA